MMLLPGQRRWTPLVALACAFLLSAAPVTLVGQSVSIETQFAFDAAGRMMVLTPATVSRIGLRAPEWPVTGDFREARLFRAESGATVLAVLRGDGSVARFSMADDAVANLRRAVDTGLLAVGSSRDRVLGNGTGIEVSQPAGNAFVRNQAMLGLVAYGPATAALFSDGGGAGAGGGYLLGAGASFFIAARTVKNRTVTRAQSIRASHGGSRGALTGLALAGVAGLKSAPERGGAVLAGAVGGTIIGFRQARGLTDGEAASAGLFADLAALTTLGVAGASGVFDARRETIEYPNGYQGVREDNSLTDEGKVALGVAVGSTIVGYTLGPRYARLASYNVTAGDATVAFTGALLGGLGFSAIPSDNSKRGQQYGAAAAGVVLGAVLTDRIMVRQADRTSADGTLVQLGGIAGALIGAGFATMADAEWRGASAAGAAGGLLGMLAADNLVGPAPDAGPARGILRQSSRALDGRVHVALGPVSSVRITF
ncbi:MAG: hypothetical protein IBJ03_08475 [Gemmatimonadaceae bacterium]|nr:hypothetical protein [Gemmatimonadaceae bacterium]